MPPAGDDNDFWLGLAATQHRLGHIAPEVIERALAIARDPSELARWEPGDRPQRQKVLAELADQLEQPAPAPKRVRPRPKADTGFEPGQHLVLQGAPRPGLLRVTRLHEDKGGQYPHVVVVAWNGKERQLKKAHRLPEVSNPKPLRRGGEALGAILVGDEPHESDYRVLDQTVDRRTPRHRWSSAHVVEWSGLARWLGEHT